MTNASPEVIDERAIRYIGENVDFFARDVENAVATLKNLPANIGRK